MSLLRTRIVDIVKCPRPRHIHLVVHDCPALPASKLFPGEVSEQNSALRWLWMVAWHLGTVSQQWTTHGKFTSNRLLILPRR